MTMLNIPNVNFATAQQAVEVALRANQSVLLLGDPGVGKTALARAVAASTQRHLGTLLGSTLDPTDVGGIPVVRVDSKGIDRMPLALIQRCCEEPCILFLDEISCAPPAVQAALLRVVLERVAGDRELHPDTRVLAAANPPEQAPGGFELSAPLMGRVAALWLRPSDDEVISYFLALGEEGSALRAEAQDFALTAKFSDKLLEIDIPPACVAGQMPWGSPRAWERVVRFRAEGGPEEALYALTAGSVGPNAAIAYRALLDLRKQLPGIEAIAADPVNAPVPNDLQMQLSALGVLPRVADINTWAAWIYASRLRTEYAVACMQSLMQRRDSPMTAPFAREGVQIRVKMMSTMLQKLN